MTWCLTSHMVLSCTYILEAKRGVRIHRKIAWRDLHISGTCMFVLYVFLPVDIKFLCRPGNYVFDM